MIFESSGKKGTGTFIYAILLLIPFGAILATWYGSCLCGRGEHFPLDFHTSQWISSSFALMSWQQPPSPRNYLDPHCISWVSVCGLCKSSCQGHQGSISRSHKCSHSLLLGHLLNHFSDGCYYMKWNRKYGRAIDASPMLANCSGISGTVLETDLASCCPGSVQYCPRNYSRGKWLY